MLFCVSALLGSLASRWKWHHVLPICRRNNAEPLCSLGFGYELAVMPEHHLRTIAGFEADLVDVLDLCEAVRNERMAKAVPFPFDLRGRADVIKALLVRSFERTDRSGCLRERRQPRGAIVG